jgi:hypothetical protein
MYERVMTDLRFVWASMAMGVISFVSYESLRAPKDAMSPLLTMA